MSKVEGRMKEFYLFKTERNATQAPALRERFPEFDIIQYSIVIYGGSGLKGSEFKVLCSRLNGFGFKVAQKRQPSSREFVTPSFKPSTLNPKPHTNLKKR